MIKFCNTSNRGLFSLSERDDDFSLAKCTLRVSTSSTSLLSALRTLAVATASKRVTMITSTYNLPQLSSLRQKFLHFLLSKLKMLDRDFFYRQILSLPPPPEKPRNMAFISSVPKCMQGRRVLWRRSVLRRS